MPDINDLSEREREILCLVAEGASNKQIAQELFISANTVKVHLRNIFSKIGVSSRTEAAMFAVSAGLVEPISDDGAGGSGVIRGNIEDLSGSTDGFGLVTTRRWISIILIVIAFTFVGLSVLFLFRDQIFSNPFSGDQPPLEESLSWQENASLPTARSGFAAAAHGGQIYVIAGESGEGVTGVVERYDPSLDKWFTLSSKPVPVTDVNAAVIGGKIFIPGGRLKSGQLTDILEVYDPLEDNWEQYASLPFPIHAYAMVAFEGKLFLFGGSDDTAYLDVVLTYDPATDEWYEQASMPTARAYSGAVVSGNRILVIGGFDGKKVLSVNELYYPERDNVGTNPWGDGIPLPDGRYGMGIVSIADTIYVLGGETSKGDKIQALQYSAQEEKWRLFSSSESETWAFLGLVRMETELFAVGGLLNNELTKRNLSYKAIYTINLPLIR
jgi:DNA-binding CsgD family transcriptional regulator